MWKKILRVFAVGLVLVLLCGAGTGWWLAALFDAEVDEVSLQQTVPAQVAYLQQLPPASRGKVLAVVSSTAVYPAAKVDGKLKKTGYELTELARFYWVLRANGFAVDIASPNGGAAPQVLDGDDMGEYDYSFLNDPQSSAQARNTLKLADVNADDYQAVYFVGGKGAMYDFPQNPDIRRLLQQMLAAQKLIVAVCHGPAALLALDSANGPSFLAGKKLTAFTNAEELLLMPDAAQRFDFLLQSALEQQGAVFDAGPRYLPNLVVDGNLLTGQNPWSVWQLAEATVRALGVTPRPRPVTAEEQAMLLLQFQQEQGSRAAQAQLPQFVRQGPLQRDLLIMMALVSAMAGNWTESIERLALVQAVKSQQQQLTPSGDASAADSR